MLFPFFFVKLYKFRSERNKCPQSFSYPSIFLKLFIANWKSWTNDGSTFGIFLSRNFFYDFFFTNNINSRLLTTNEIDGLIRVHVVVSSSYSFLNWIVGIFRVISELTLQFSRVNGFRSELLGRVEQAGGLATGLQETKQ